MKLSLFPIIFAGMLLVGCTITTSKKSKIDTLVNLEITNRIPKVDSPVVLLNKTAVFYCRWGAYNAIRRYKVVDTNPNGYFVKWIDAGQNDSNGLEFMPASITKQKEFKLLTPPRR